MYISQIPWLSGLGQGAVLDSPASWVQSAGTAGWLAVGVRVIVIWAQGNKMGYLVHGLLASLQMGVSKRRYEGNNQALPKAVTCIHQLSRPLYVLELDDTSLTKESHVMEPQPRVAQREGL